VVNVYCSLFAFRMMKRVPIVTRLMATTSYLATNFSPRYFQEMKKFMMMAELELQAIKVRSQNGKARKWPKLPRIVMTKLQMPFSEQKSCFWIV